MSRHDDAVSLRHMLDHSREVREMMAGRLRETLDSDRMLNLAVVRLLEIVGEAATRVSAAKRDQLPGIQWSAIRGFRNRIVHGYDRIDFDVVWTILQDEIPPPIAQLEGIVDA